MKQFKQALMVLQFALILLTCVTATNAYAQDTRQEKTIKTFYSGFVNKDWNTVASTLADDFNFTSPAPDDHITLSAFHEKCFPTSKFTKEVNFLKMVESGNQVFLLVQINTTDNKIVRNMDYYTFNSAGKIQSYECFFGTGIGYPGHNSN
jgi:hypothetical protein